MPVAPISVVVPAHNGEDFIKAAIDSVHQQTLRPSEIIVVADACTDGTAQIAASLGCKVIDINQRIMSAGLNVGVKAATQPWIAFLDADDYWHPEKLKRQWSAVSNFPGAALCFCDLLMIIDEEIIQQKPPNFAHRWEHVGTWATEGSFHFIESVAGRFLLDFFVITTTVMVRREVFAELGWFDEGLLFGQTLEFFAGTGAAWRCVCGRAAGISSPSRSQPHE